MAERELVVRLSSESRLACFGPVRGERVFEFALSTGKVRLLCARSYACCREADLSVSISVSCHLEN